MSDTNVVNTVRITAEQFVALLNAASPVTPLFAFWNGARSQMEFNLGETGQTLVMLSGSEFRFRVGPPDPQAK